LKGATECADPEKVNANSTAEIGGTPFNVRLNSLVGRRLGQASIVGWQALWCTSNLKLAGWCWIELQVRSDEGVVLGLRLETEQPFRDLDAAPVWGMDVPILKLCGPNLKSVT
jgi:hypothetical protein